MGSLEPMVKINDSEVRRKEYHKSLEKNRVAEADSCSGGEAKDSDSMTALLQAACVQNWREVRRLILDGADPSVSDGQGLMALHYAAFLGSKELTLTLIEHWPAWLFFCEIQDGTTSLHLSSARSRKVAWSCRPLAVVHSGIAIRRIRPGQ
jgi:hypothetical protein